MNSEKQTILVVDDTPGNIDVIRGVLINQYKVKVAINGKKALELVEVEKPDLILLDIMLPGMDGYEVCKILKSNLEFSSIPIMFLTAKSKAQDESLGFELGAADYITKPINPIVLLARIRTQLSLADQARHLEHLVQERTQELNETRLNVIRKLGKAAEFKDNETGMHVIRMSIVSSLIARAHGLSEAQCDLILQAAPMHDIGKIGIPDNVLLKPGPLDEDEWIIMRTHPEIGAQIIGKDTSPLLTMAYDVAMTHHEKWNGTGYPRGLAAKDIPLSGRIVAIADVFDALISKRPYKAPWPTDKAIDHIKSEAGIHFDPELVEAFLEVIVEVVNVAEEFGD